MIRYDIRDSQAYCFSLVQIAMTGVTTALVARVAAKAGVIIPPEHAGELTGVSGVAGETKYNIRSRSYRAGGLSEATGQTRLGHRHHGGKGGQTGKRCRIGHDDIAGVTDPHVRGLQTCPGMKIAVALGTELTHGLDVSPGLGTAPGIIGCPQVLIMISGPNGVLPVVIFGPMNPIKKTIAVAHRTPLSRFIKSGAIVEGGIIIVMRPIDCLGRAQLITIPMAAVLSGAHHLTGGVQGVIVAQGWIKRGVKSRRCVPQ